MQFQIDSRKCLQALNEIPYKSRMQRSRRDRGKPGNQPCFDTARHRRFRKKNDDGPHGEIVN